jgi:hypothetical protein
MYRRIEKVLLGSLLLLAAAIVAVWIHSSLAGYEQTWVDPADESCGRIATAHGRFLYQKCDLKSLRDPGDPTLLQPLRMPAKFVVGTNPDGERTIVASGQFSIPFAFPAPGSFIGLTTKLEDISDPATSTRWADRWQEYTIAYWFLLLLVLLPVAAEGISRLLRKRRVAQQSSAIVS